MEETPRTLKELITEIRGVIRDLKANNFNEAEIEGVFKDMILSEKRYEESKEKAIG